MGRNRTAGEARGSGVQLVATTGWCGGGRLDLQARCSGPPTNNCGRPPLRRAGHGRLAEPGSRYGFSTGSLTALPHSVHDPS
jgi:hypothetical protein